MIDSLLPILATLTAGLTGPIACWLFISKWIKSLIADEAADRAAAVTLIEREIAHNKANADQKFIAADHRIEQTLRDIVVLQRADERHTTAIQHLDQSIKSYHSTIERRLEDFSRIQSFQFDAITERLRELGQASRF